MASKSKGEMFKYNWCLKRYKVQIIGKFNVDVVFFSFGFHEQIEGKWIKINKECYSMIYYENNEFILFEWHSMLLMKLLLFGRLKHLKPNLYNIQTWSLFTLMKLKELATINKVNFKPKVNQSTKKQRKPTRRCIYKVTCGFFFFFL